MKMLKEIIDEVQDDMNKEKSECNRRAQELDSTIFKSSKGSTDNHRATEDHTDIYKKMLRMCDENLAWTAWMKSQKTHALLHNDFLFIKLQKKIEDFFR